MLVIETPALWTPSYKQGFARSQAEAANPGLRDGLVSMWPFSLGATGTTVSDYGQLNQDATFVNLTGASWASSRLGSVVDFTSTSDKIKIVDSSEVPNYESQARASWSFWVWHDTMTRDHDLIAEGNHTATSEILIWADNDTSDFYKFIVNGSGTQTTASAVDLGVWTHIVLTFEGGSQFRFFKNGVEDANSPFATAVANTGTSWGDVHLGADTGTSRTLDGKLAFASIHHRLLLPNEIQSDLHKDPHAIVRPMQRVVVGTTGGAPPANAPTGALCGSLVGPLGGAI